MNISLCYSGQIRNFDECFPTHIKHIVEANPEHSFFIIGHFWHDTGLDGQPFFKGYSERGTLNKNDSHKILEINPHSIMFDRPVNFQTSLIPDKRFPHPIDRTLSMFLSIYKSNAIKNDFAKMRNINFDLNIRLRTDLFFHKNLNMSEYSQEFCHVNNQYVHTNYALNDLFAIGSNDNMNIYSSVFSNINEIVKDGCAVNPECFLGYHLQKHSTKIKKHSFQRNIFNLYRDIS